MESRSTSRVERLTSGRCGWIRPNGFPVDWASRLISAAHSGATALVPPGVVTWTSTAPAACAGLVIFSWVADTTVTAVPAVPAKVAFVAPVNFEPVTVTIVAPAIGPLAGDTAVIVGAGGAAPVTGIRVADQLRLTQLRVVHLAHKGRRLTLLTIEDATEAFCLRAALDTSEYAALVVDARGRVLAFNKLVVGLFGKAEVGADVAQWLPQADPGLRWWEPGLTGRRKMHIKIGSRIYQLTSSAIAVAGEEERIFSVSFLPVAKGGTDDSLGSSSTVLTGTMRQLR